MPKDQSVKILAGNGFPKSSQAYFITRGTCGVHVGELTGLLWGVNFGVNRPKYCEITRIRDSELVPTPQA